MRGWNFFFSNTVGFFAANIVAYGANRAWVFQPGRHDHLKEFFLFFLIAGTAYVVGTPLGSLLVAHLSVNEYFVYAIVVGLFNYG
ncbi:GtrA family protein [Pseudomonadota bacterium]